MKGCDIANYVEFIDFIKDKEGTIIGAKLRDNIAKKEFEVKSKMVVNCTGVFGDELRI